MPGRRRARTSGRARPCRHRPRSACRAPARRVPSPSLQPSLTSEAREHVEKLVDLLLALALGAGAQRVSDARLDVPAEQELLDLIERSLDGRDLEQDVDAIRLAVDHPLETLHLSLDPAQPPKGFGLRLLVDHRSTPRRHIPPGGSIDPGCAAVNSAGCGPDASWLEAIDQASNREGCSAPVARRRPVAAALALFFSGFA